MLRFGPFRSGIEQTGVTFPLARVRETHLVGLRESPRSLAALSMRWIACWCSVASELMMVRSSAKPLHLCSVPWIYWVLWYVVAFLGSGGVGWSDGMKIRPFFIANLHWVVEMSTISVEPHEYCSETLPSQWYSSTVALYQPIGSSESSSSHRTYMDWPIEGSCERGSD